VLEPEKLRPPRVGASLSNVAPRRTEVERRDIEVSDIELDIEADATSIE
jgi:hypothetical protein